MRYLTLSVTILLGLSFLAAPATGDESLRIATFNVDATPPIGSPVAYAVTRKIDDSLSARGIVLMGQDKPIVLAHQDTAPCAEKTKAEDRRVVPPRHDCCWMVRGDSEVRQHEISCHAEGGPRPRQSSEYQKTRVRD